MIFLWRSNLNGEHRVAFFNEVQQSINSFHSQIIAEIGLLKNLSKVSSGEDLNPPHTPPLEMGRHTWLETTARGLTKAPFMSLLPYWCTLELTEDTVLPCWGLIPGTVSNTEASSGLLEYLCSPRLWLLSLPIVLRTIDWYELVRWERLPHYQLGINFHRKPVGGLTTRKDIFYGVL